MARPVLSLVLPIFNEEEVIPELHASLQKFLSELALDTEVIFVDDGSTDLSLQMLRGIVAVDPRYRVLSFSRNFGHQTAITAGIDYARGHAVVVMDADLQDPPEVVLEMVAKWREGYDVVYGKRATRVGETAFKLFTAKMFYRFFATMIPIEVPLDTGDFRLMSRRVVVTLRALKESHRFVRGLVSWVGFRQTAVLYDRPARAAGETKFPLRKMLRFALDGITSFSIVPLRVALYLGLFVSVLAGGVILWALFVHFIMKDTVPGWTALIVVFTLLSSVQLVMIGILGEYVGRIYEQIKERPLYVVGERVNLGERDDDALDEAPPLPVLQPALAPQIDARARVPAGGTIVGMPAPNAPAPNAPAPNPFPPLEDVPIPVIAPIPPNARGASETPPPVSKTAPMNAVNPNVTMPMATVDARTERAAGSHAPTMQSAATALPPVSSERTAVTHPSSEPTPSASPPPTAPMSTGAPRSMPPPVPPKTRRG